METRKRTGRSKRLETIREERRKQKQKQRLTTLFVIVGGVLLIISVIAVIALVKPRKTGITSTPVSITPIARSQSNGLSMGDADAPVQIDIWEDFQCSSCVRYTQSVEKQLIESYIADGTVYYTFHHYPFFDRSLGGNESNQAANASMCANEQGRFWDFHDMIFANWQGEGVGSFSENRLKLFAEMLELDVKDFNDCFDENRYKDQIEQDYQAGIAAGVTGTPTIFVNNIEITPGYVPTYEQLKQAIEEALKNQ